MTIYITSITPDGRHLELQINPGCTPMVFLDSILQDPADYMIYPGNIIIFNAPPLHTKWYPWFAWRPVRLHGQWTWLKTIYRQYLPSPGGGIYRYGDDFDVLKDPI